MYRWYEKSQVCYVYLADVPRAVDVSPEDSFRHSRWFTRGWTLQELLAPTTVVFYDRYWRETGTKWSLRHEISLATGIRHEDMIDPQNASIAVKMSWASNRQTTRLEDTAYCLLGLFDLNIPLLYGEGRKAFMRLQHELVRTMDEDESIFAWTGVWFDSGLLASSPDAFANSGNIVVVGKPRQVVQPRQITNKTITMDCIYRKLPSSQPENCLMILNCKRRGSSEKALGIHLERQSSGLFIRSDDTRFVSCVSLRNVQAPFDFHTAIDSFQIMLYAPRVPCGPSLTMFNLSMPQFVLRMPRFGNGVELIERDWILLSPVPDMTLGFEGWRIRWAGPKFEMSMDFTTDSGESFRIIINRGWTSVANTGINVIVPDLAQMTTVENHEEPDQRDRGGKTQLPADRFSCILQRGSQLSVALKKRNLNNKLHCILDVEIEDSPRENT